MRYQTRHLNKTGEHYARDSHTVVRCTHGDGDQITLAVRRVVPRGGTEELQIEVEIFRKGKKRDTTMHGTFLAPPEIADLLAKACATQHDTLAPTRERERGPIAYVLIQPDSDGLSALKRQQAEADGDTRSRVVLEVLGYRYAGDRRPKSLGDVDFYSDGGDWTTGTFYNCASLAPYPHLQEIAREMGLSD